MKDRGYFLIEGRWEKGHRGINEFFHIDEIGGSLDDAKAVAQSYLDRHTSQAHLRLEWSEGDNGCHYAPTQIITFRVSR
jgi:hypothetical protein